jgi:beta-mannosidase
LDEYIHISQPMYEAVKDFDDTRILVAGSAIGAYKILDPEESKLFEEIAWNSDTHLYDAHFGLDIRWTEKRDPNLVTEFGEIGVPAIESLRRFMNAEDIWPPNWEAWRQRFNGSVVDAYWPIVHQHRLMWTAAEPLARHNRGVGTVEEFIDITQKWQSYVNKYTIEAFRLNKYASCNGMTNFHFVDMYPAITTALVDYYRVPKDAYYAVQQAYRPIHVMMKWPADRYEAGWLLARPIYVVNDYHRTYPDCTVSWSLTDPDGTVLRTHQTKISVPDDSLVQAGAVEWQLGPEPKAGTYTIRIDFFDGTGEKLSANEYTTIVV